MVPSILKQMACLILNMGQISVIHNNFTFTSDIFLLQFLLNSVTSDVQQNLTKQQNFKLKLLKIKKGGMAHPGS